MTKATEDALYAVLGQIRQVFHRLGAATDALHAGSTISASQRGVLESLHMGGAQTVPQMARARPVSRQFIQRLVNDLIDRKLVRVDPNPAHQRSSLIRLTEQGEEAFLALRTRECSALARVAERIDASDLAACSKLLCQLTEALGEPPRFEDAPRDGMEKR